METALSSAKLQLTRKLFSNFRKRITEKQITTLHTMYCPCTLPTKLLYVKLTLATNANGIEGKMKRHTKAYLG